MPPISDLVLLSKLDITFHSNSKYTTQSSDLYDQNGIQQSVRKEELWKRTKRLGKGGFGVVWLEQCVRGDGEGKNRAVKIIDKLDAGDYSRELDAISLFSQPKYRHRFVQSLGWYEDDDSIYIAMEYLSNGDLHQCLDSPLPEMEAQQIVAQVLQGLDYMHHHGFAHRDLKPANILVSSKGPQWYVKIADFGVSKRAIDQITALRTQAGTRAFCAPEIIGFISSGKKSAYTHAVDIWSLGATAFFVATGESLFDDQHRLREYSEGIFTFPMHSLLANGFSEDGSEFVRSLLALRPMDRPNIKECLQHQWLRPITKPAAPNTDWESKISGLSLIDSLPPNLLPSARWTTHNDVVTQAPLDHISTSEEETPPTTEDFISITSSSATHISSEKDGATLPDSRQIDVSNYEMEQKPTSNSSPTNEEAKSSITTPEVVSSPDQIGSDPTTVKQFHGRNKVNLTQVDGGSLSATKNLRRDEAENGEPMIEHDHEGEIHTAHKLGLALSKRQKYEEAEAEYRAAVAVRTRTLGADHEDTLDSMDKLGVMLHKQHKYTEAEPVYRKALAGRDKTLGPDNENTLHTMHNLGSVLNNGKKYNEAESIYRKALAGRERILGPDHKDTLSSMHDLGWALHTNNKCEKAESIYIKTLAGRERTLGPDHKYTLQTMHNLGVALDDQGKYEEAESVNRKALAGRLRTLGPDHEDTLHTVHNLGLALDGQNKYEEAESVYRKALAGRERTIGPEHKDTLQTMHNLGRVLDGQEKYEEAEVVYRKALAGRERTFGPDHKRTLETVSRLNQTTKNLQMRKGNRSLGHRKLSGTLQRGGVVDVKAPDAEKQRRPLSAVLSAFKRRF